MRPLVFAVAGVLALAGCSSSADNLPAPAFANSQAVPLSVDQGKQALLTLRDLPKGWVGGEPVGVMTPEEDRAGTYSPAECVVLFHPRHELGRPSTAAQTVFTGPNHRRIDEVIQSWPTELPALAQKTIAVLPACKTFTVTDRAGLKTAFVARRVALSGVVDGVALRAEITTDRDGFVMYLVDVVRAGTTLHLQLSGAGLTDAEVAGVATKATARLKAVTK